MSTLKKSILDLEDEIMVRTDNNRTNIVTQIKSLYRDLEQSFDKER